MRVRTPQGLCSKGILAAGLVLVAATALAAGETDLVGQWQFDAAHLGDGGFRPLAGAMSASVVGPVRFGRQVPKALVLDGNSKAGHRVEITDDLARARLPREAISAEAWVRVDKAIDWGGIVGAIQDNGDFERGWLLGHRKARFAFAVATAHAGRLTYLTAPKAFQGGCWYHVVGTYDGAEQRLYLDGRLVARSTAQRGAIRYPTRGFYTIGAYRDDNELHTFTGRIERVSIYARVLSPGEVRAHFAARKKRFPGIEPQAPEPVIDWPTQRRDSQRSATAPGPLTLPLHRRWVYRARHAPRPAWPPPAGQDYWHKKFDLPALAAYDRAFHVVAVGESVYFASSADDRVTCLDARTGRPRWSFFAEGPVRLAPTVANGKVLFGSDDGWAYCLDAADGSLLWKHHAGPAERRIPGNERIISLFAVRTGVLVTDGVAHFCAGLFPEQGVYRAAVSVRTGRAAAGQRIEASTQGYLVRQLGGIVSPTGRSAKRAVLSRATRRGKLPPGGLLADEYSCERITVGSADVLGGQDKVAAFDTDSARLLWSAPVVGRAYSLAFARGRLLVSTDRGQITCFAPEPGPSAAVDPPKPVDLPGRDEAAERICRVAGVRRGYALLLGADVPLAASLAKRTQLRIVLREPDASRASAGRARLAAAGLYGTRVAVHHGPVDKLPYAAGLFNVVVATPAARRAEALRVLCPGRGVAIFGDAPADVVRRELPAGAGEWTHTWADPGNTACSGDRLVGGATALQWFGRPGPREMIDRHHRNTPPLCKGGRLFVPGDQVIFAVDAYNGAGLWKTHVPNSRRLGVFLDCGSMAVDDERLHVAVGDRCVGLDVRDGRRRQTHTMPQALPGSKRLWGYLARVGGLLVGSGRKPNATYTETSWEADNALWHDEMKLVTSDFLFALDARTGKTRWTHASGVIPNTSLAIGGGRVYFVESHAPAAVGDPLGRMTMRTFLPGPNRLVALELASGRVAWQRPIDLGDCQHIVYLSYADGMLVLSGNRYVEKRLWYSVYGLDAATGRQRWRRSHNTGFKPKGGHGEQNRHPTIVGETIYAWPLAYKLRTGEPIAGWRFSRHGHGCGNISASAHCLFWRGANPWIWDLRPGGGPRRLNAVSRPGCFINILPVAGLVLIPEASSGCTCDYPMQTSVAFRPVQTREK